MTKNLVKKKMTKNMDPDYENYIAQKQDSRGRHHVKGKET